MNQQEFQKVDDLKGLVCIFCRAPLFCDLPLSDAVKSLICRNCQDEFDGHCHPDDDHDEFYGIGGSFGIDECGQLASGVCLKAGSEECDWECPFRRDLR